MEKKRIINTDYQSAVARHLAESKDCAVAYSDTSFRVVRACPLSLKLRKPVRAKRPVFI